MVAKTKWFSLKALVNITPHGCHQYSCVSHWLTALFYSVIVHLMPIAIYVKLTCRLIHDVQYT